VIAEANDHLDTIEDEYNVIVILAVAHGSHAWGLHNEDSDYDIKAVYIAESLSQYVELGEHTETITREFSEFEIEAWDVKKFAQLLQKSNDQAIDVLRSPIAYRERLNRSELREFIEESYNPIALYHAYRSISKNNYRKYLSHHLVSNRNDVYPILDKLPKSYRVLNLYTGVQMCVPDNVVDSPEEFIEIEFDKVDTSEDDHRYCSKCGSEPETLPLTFRTTQTRRTVKRNLAVFKASMQARYLRVTGERGAHELPSVDFPTFLETQAPDVFEQHRIETVKELVEKKRNGDNSEVGDLVGRSFAHPEREINPSVHAKSAPSQERINEFISQATTLATSFHY